MRQKRVECAVPLPPPAFLLRRPLLLPREGMVLSVDLGDGRCFSGALMVGSPGPIHTLRAFGLLLPGVVCRTSRRCAAADPRRVAVRRLRRLSSGGCLSREPVYCGLLRYHIGVGFSREHLVKAHPMPLS